MADQRLKTIPEVRGHSYTPVPRCDTAGNPMKNDPMYSARSYTAMYGITIEEGEHVLASCNTHTQADRMITSTLAADPARLREVLGRDDIKEDDLTEEERRMVERFKRSRKLKEITDD